MFRFFKTKSKSDNNLVKIYPDDLTDAEELLKNWSRSAATMHESHHEAAAQYTRQIKRLGIVTASLRAIVSTTIFSNNFLLSNNLELSV